MSGHLDPPEQPENLECEEAALKTYLHPEVPVCFVCTVHSTRSEGAGGIHELFAREIGWADRSSYPDKIEILFPGKDSRCGILLCCRNVFLFGVSADLPLRARAEPAHRYAVLQTDREDRTQTLHLWTLLPSLHH